MLKMKRIISLLIVVILAFSMFSCVSNDEERAKNLVYKTTILNKRDLRDAKLTHIYEDKGWDGSLYYYVFAVEDGFASNLENYLTSLPLSEEARGFYEKSSVLNGESVADIPDIENGYYYYLNDSDASDERVYLVVFDASSGILYYFAATGQAVRFPRKY